MSTDTIPARQGGQVIYADWFNLLRQVLSGDLVPRNSGAIPQDGIGGLGTAVFKWIRAYILSGHWSAGDIKPRYSFAGNAPVGQGWMLCDGRQVTQAAYETEHGAGSWTTYVGTSPLLNKFLPNLVSRYPVGISATPQDGSVAITAVGLPDSGYLFAHNHQWFDGITNSADYSWILNGSPLSLNPFPLYLFAGATRSALTVYGNSGSWSNQSYWTAFALGIGTALPLPKVDIRPDSIETEFYMRIV